MKEFDFDVKDTARSNNHTATFVEEKENQDGNIMTIPMQMSKMNEYSIASGLPENLLHANYEDEYTENEDEEEIAPISYFSNE